MKDKLCKSLEDAIKAVGLRDGMTVSFHHHLRNGDYVTPMVLNTISKMGYRNIHVTTTSLMNGMSKEIFPQLIENGTVTFVETNNADTICGGMISRGLFPEVCNYRTHGSRSYGIRNGHIKIDVAFVAAAAADPMGNMNGVDGPNAFGSMGYAYDDAMYADKVVVVTDHLVPYPLQRVSIEEIYVDYVVKVDAIGDPNAIATGSLKPAKDPVSMVLAKYATAVIEHSGLLKDGFSFQAGAGGPSIATTQNIKRIMQERKIQGSFMSGGITGFAVDLLEAGVFNALLDVQDFDRMGAASLKNNPRHCEMTAAKYADASSPSCVVDQLDVVVLGGLQVDTQFNVNVNVNSSGYFQAGAGGHGDTAEGSKLAMIVAPLTRTRFPTVVEKVLCKTTPGKDINVVITQYGVAVNPNSPELKQRLKDAKVKLMEIEDMQRLAEKLVGKPKPVQFGDKLVANIIHRRNEVIDQIYNVIED